MDRSRQDPLQPWERYTLVIDPQLEWLTVVADVIATDMPRNDVGWDYGTVERTVCIVDDIIFKWIDWI